MKTKHPLAFTLIELLVVITIVGVLGSLTFINIRRAQFKARNTRALTDITNGSRAVEDFRLETDRYISDPDGSYLHFDCRPGSVVCDFSLRSLFTGTQNIDTEGTTNTYGFSFSDTPGKNYYYAYTVNGINAICSNFLPLGGPYCDQTGKQISSDINTQSYNLCARLVPTNDSEPTTFAIVNGRTLTLTTGEESCPNSFTGQNPLLPY